MGTEGNRESFMSTWGTVGNTATGAPSAQGRSQGYAVSAKSLNDADNFTTIAEALFSCCGSRDKKKLSREDENLPEDPSKKAEREKLLKDARSSKSEWSAGLD